MPKRIGYSRVSTKDQNLSSQEADLVKAGCEKIFSDVQSGAKFIREGLDGLLEFLRPGDTGVFWSLLRLGRDIIETSLILRDIEAMGVKVEAVTHEIDSSTAFGRFYINITLAFGQFERELGIERSIRGLRHAASEGRIGGRKMGERKANVQEVKKRFNSARKSTKTKQQALQVVAEEFGIGPATVARYIKE